MRKISLLLSLLLIVAVDVSQAQLAKDSWAFGFGFKYPRFQCQHYASQYQLWWISFIAKKFL